MKKKEKLKGIVTKRGLEKGIVVEVINSDSRILRQAYGHISSFNNGSLNPNGKIIACWTQYAGSSTWWYDIVDDRSMSKNGNIHVNDILNDPEIPRDWVV